MLATTTLADAVLAGLGRACLQGGIFVLLVWAVCRLFPRLPSGVRFWLWWLASAKCVLTVFCAGLLTLPILAPQIATLPGALPAAVRSLVPSPATVPVSAPRIEAAPNAALPDDGKDSDTLPVSSAVSETASAPLVRKISLAEGIVLAYGIGLLLALLRTAQGALRLRRLLGETSPVTDSETLDALRELGAFRLRESARVHSPFAVGLLRPVIVLPVGFAQLVTPAQLRLALAHEAIHIRRGDLWLGLLPRYAQTLLYFFPFAFLACRECEHTREEICDSRALALFPNVRRAEYGQLLLRFSPSATLPPAVGMASAPGFSRLKRRLERVRQGDKPLHPLAKVALFLLTACFATGAAPWRLAAMGATLEQANQALDALFPAAPRYEIVDLGTPNATYSDAFAISETGQVAGTLSENGRGKAFVYDAARTIYTTISAPGSLHRSLATGISHNGTVVAAAYNRETRPQAFVWNRGRETKIDGLRGFRYSRALGVNALGIVVGSAQGGRTDDGAVRARAIVFQNGKSRDLGTLGGPYSHASGINDSGLVVGKADLTRSRQRGENGVTHAFAYRIGEKAMQDMGTLPGGLNSRASAVNGWGEVVGFSETEAGARAFVGGEHRELCDLGTLPGAAKSVAHAISDRGWIVGAAATGTESRAVLWVRKPGETGGRLLDLNDCVLDRKNWTLEAARGINRQGWIVGQGMIAGRHHAFLLRPIR